MSVAHAEPRTIELDPARQFDFWLGEWDCTWHADGLEHIGTNSVYADLGGMVLVENFDGRPSLDYQGLSYSVYDRKAQCWKQTWVDSEGDLPRLQRPLRGRRDGAAPRRRRRPLPDALGADRRERIRLVVPALRRRRRRPGRPSGRSATAVSYSWVDPHFAALYARREEERLAERLVTRMRERSVRELFLQTTGRCHAGWMENDAVLRGGHLRLL